MKNLPSDLKAEVEGKGDKTGFLSKLGIGKKDKDVSKRHMDMQSEEEIQARQWEGHWLLAPSDAQWLWRDLAGGVRAHGGVGVARTLQILRGPSQAIIRDAMKAPAGKKKSTQEGDMMDADI